ncbi:MAG TPA: PHB depolymerase family esterase [Polyangia bacterium]|nr:PHB depolymerase family esterase [Polyangia bacterium]
MTSRLAAPRALRVITITLALLAARPGAAASLQPVANWGASGVPSYISMYIYVPDKPAQSPPILVVSHFCGGSASAVFGQAQGGGVVAAADKYGFIMVFPQTTNPATSAKCWDVGSKASLTHDGGGDTQAVAEMVKYTIATYHANANRVYATGDSSGAMMTQALMAVYPDVFKGGASFAGVPAGCWSDGWSAASNWGGTCASGNDIMTAQAWGDLARGMDPGYTGPRPRVQLFHGDADPTINFKNFGEAIKQWTNVLGLPTNPTTTTTGLTLGTHQATRQQWKDTCGYVVLDTFESIGGDHGPSDALFDATYVVPFLGLDNTGTVDPELAQCGSGGAGGGGGGGSTGKGGAGGGTGGASGKGGSTGGATGSGGVTGTGGANVTGTGGATGSGGSTGAGGVTGSGGSTGAGGVTGAGGASATGAGGATGSGGSSATGTGGEPGTGGSGAGADSGSSGCSCDAGGAGAAGFQGSALAMGLALLLGARRRRCYASAPCSPRSSSGR